jgi:hypothetical protein
MSAASSRREWWVAVLLVLCVALVAFWEIRSHLASRPFDSLRLGAADFAGFHPGTPSWVLRLVHVKATPTEPTVIAYEARHRPEGTAAPGAPVLVRLVHGYNMVDCMRIKQYQVDLLADRRRPADESSLPVQVWRLTSPDGKRMVWVTSMLRTSDFAATDTDTRDMAFPRVGTPDDPAWAPTGLKWSSFRHPVRNFRLYLRGKWNASRSDLLTFLRLRQPAWASDVLLTMVSEYHGPVPVTEATEAEVTAYVLDAHNTMYRQLRAHGGLAARAQQAQ